MDTIGPYDLIDILGKGGMGVVYLAEHKESGLQVALKTVLVSQQIMIQAIRREILGISRLSHPGIVRIVDSGNHAGIPWYAMKLLQGVTLSNYCLAKRDRTDSSPSDNVSRDSSPTKPTRPFDRRIAESWWTQSLSFSKLQRLDIGDSAINRNDHSLDSFIIEEQYIRTVCSIIYRLCYTLAYIHGQGIVHKDLKPNNIVMTQDDQPVIIDFGLMTHFSGAISREELFVDASSAGTILYMSPEQIQGKLVDARTDLYAVGCILYELLTGIPPFGRETPGKIYQAHLEEMPIPPSQLQNKIPKDIDNLILQLLAKSPRYRIGYADDIARVLAPYCFENVLEHLISLPKTYLYRPGFSGREDLIEQLCHYRDDLKSPKGHFILITGESGVGKTRFLLEFTKLVDFHAYRVFEGECRVQSNRPLDAFRKLLQYVLDRCISGGLEETEHLIGHRGKVFGLFEPMFSGLPGQDNYPEPPVLSAKASKLRLYSYILHVIETIIQEQPVIFMIDDIQWADDLTLGFFEFLLHSSTLHEKPILFIATCRTEEMNERLSQLAEDPEITNIKLTRLTKQAITNMIVDMLALPKAPPVFSDFMTRQSEGNPFFVAEYLRAAVDQSILWRDNSGKWQVAESSSDTSEKPDYSAIALPTTLVDLVERRLMKLSERTRQILDIAAVAGREVEIEVLAAVGNMSESDITDALLELSKRYIIEDVIYDKVFFCHDKIREVTYSQIPKSQGMECHRRIADTIITIYKQNLSPYYADIARHFEMGDDLEKAVEWYEKAALELKRLYSYKDTIDFLSKALALLTERDLDTRFRLLRTRVEVYDFLGYRNEQLHDLEYMQTIADGLNNRHYHSIVARLKFDYYVIVGKYVEAEKEANNVIDLAKILNDRSLEVKGCMLFGSALNRHGKFSEALDYFNKAYDLVKTIDNQHLRGNILNHLGIVNLSMSDHDRALYNLEQALVIFRDPSIGDRQAEGAILHNLGMIQTEKWNFGQARNHYEQALTIFRQIGDKNYESNALIALGNICCRTGQYEDAITYLETAMNIAQQISDPRGECLALINLGFILIQKEDLDLAENYCQRALDIVQNLPSQLYSGNVMTVLGHVYAAQKRFQKALDMYFTAYNYHKQAGMSDQACEPLAGIVRIQLRQKQLEAAMMNVDEIIEHIDKSTLSGTLDPLNIYYTCFLTLAEANDERARAIIDKTYHFMMDLAKHLDPGIRENFLDNIPLHQQIKASWKQVHES